MVTKHNIVDGVIKFVENDMAKASGAAASKLIVLLAKNILKKNEKIIDVFFGNPIIKMLMPEVDGKYDIENIVSVIKDTANEVGCISLTIPKIPFLLSNGDEIKFNSEDIDTISKYINEAAVKENAVATPVVNNNMVVSNA